MEGFKLRYLIEIIRSMLQKRVIKLIVFSAIILPVISCATGDMPPAGSEIEMDRTSFSFSMSEHPFDIFSEYRIAPGDVLDVLFQIRTWGKKEAFKIALDYTIKIQFIYAPELDTTQMVRPDGKITLAFLGDVNVLGKSIDDLTKELKERYSEILQIPEIIVTVPEFRSSIKELKADLHTAPRGLSRLVTVRPDGYVTFPMTGDVFVAGKTIPEVNKILNDTYENILPDLHCDLFLEKHAGSLIYVVGQVRAPGAYNIPRPVTVFEALSLAGSHLAGAKLDSIIVIRKHEKKMVATRIDLGDALSFNSEPPPKQFFLQPNDIVYVPKTWIREAAEVAKDIADFLFFRGWSVGLGFSWELHNEPVPTTTPTTTTTITIP